MRIFCDTPKPGEANVGMCRANVNLAGNVFYVGKDKYAWIVDTEATNHMISDG